MGKACADQRDTEAGGDEAFYHADAWQLHPDLKLRGVGTKQLVHKLAGVTGFGDQQRLACDVINSDSLLSCQGVFGTNHQHELVAKDGVGLQAGRFYWQGHDADIDRAVLQLLDDLVAEVAIDTDLDFRVEAAIFGEHFGQNVKASGFVGADDESASRGDALIGDGEERFLAQFVHALGVAEQHSASGGEADDFAGAVEQLVTVFLLELTNLCADRGLGTKHLLSGAGKATQFHDFQEGD